MGHGYLKLSRLFYLKSKIIQGNKFFVNLQIAFNYATCFPSRVYGFGLAEHGALGLKKDFNTKVKNYLMKPVRHFFAEENCVTSVECGFGFTLFSASRCDYKVFGCGINTDFQLGYHEDLSGCPLSLILTPVPIHIDLRCSNTEIISLSAGRAHSAILTDNEGLFLLGANNYGQCGRVIQREDKFNGMSLVNCIRHLNNERIVDVCCGQDHTIMLTDSGKVWSCGWGADGQTGLGKTDMTFIPMRVEGFIEDEIIIKIVGKSETVLALSCKGEVFGWGNTESFQLLDEKKVEQSNCPIKLENICDIGRVKDIAAGGSFCAALNEEGDVFVWGYGILGGGPELQKALKPTLIPKTLFGCNELLPSSRVTNIACGLSHLAAVTNYNHLYTWGKNRHGCLGIGHLRDQYFPYKVALSAPVTKVSCGLDHTMLLASTC